MGRLKDALLFNCPQCGKGKLFPRKGLFTMHERCSNCDLKYEKEGGFFYGAMYISYALNVAFFIIVLIVFFNVEDQVDWRIYMGSYLLITFLLTRFIFRLSRSIWLMLNIKYEEKV
jgi:uncharacterized protein (DUF983 family)